MKSYILRLIQRGLAFTITQVTIFLYDKDTYIQLNEIILVYLLALSIIQPLLQNIWLNKQDLVKDFIVSIFVAILLSFVMQDSQYLIITFIFVISRMFERYWYILKLKHKDFDLLQIRVVYLYLFELFFVSLFALFGNDIVYRVIPSVIIFIFCYFIYGRYNLKDKLIQVSSWKKYLARLLKSSPVTVYFFLSVYLINIDRKLLNYTEELNVSYLLSINVINVLFSLISINIDKIRKSLTNNEYPQIKLFGIFLIYLLFGTTYFLAFNLTSSIYGLASIGYKYYTSYLLLNFILICYMMYSAYFIHIEAFRIVLVYLFVGIFAKIVLSNLGCELYIANIISTIILSFGIVDLKNIYDEKL